MLFVLGKVKESKRTRLKTKDPNRDNGKGKVNTEAVCHCDYALCMDTVTKGHLLLMKLTYYAIPVLGLAIILVAQPSSCNAQPRKIQLSHAGSYIAQAYSKLEDYKEAIADYTQAIEIDPNYADAYYNRGIAHRKVGDTQAAIADYTQAIKIDPNDAKVYHNRGIARSALEDYQGAIADHTQALEIAPNFTSSRHCLDIARRRLAETVGSNR